MDLTIIITFYDETAFLRSAVDSIRAQGLDAIQLLIVNDNPERFDVDTVARLAGPGPIEIVQHDRNRGLSAARNSGLARATGRYVGFLDADDLYTLGGLTSQAALAQSSGADMVHAQCLFTSPGKRDARTLPRDHAFFGTNRVAHGLLRAEEAQFITSSWSSLYRREFLSENALEFDVAQPRFEDRLFVLHTVTRAESIAFTGAPARVWRGRAGSISVTRATPETHLLQVQLLEKCMAHIREEVAIGRLPQRFEKRELFNTVSRLIWDLDVVQAILERDDPIYRDLAQRIPALLGDDSFGHAIFDDPILKPINRVGMRTRKGRITRTDFFDVHRHLRQGDFAAAHQILQTTRPVPRIPAAVPPATAKRLVLHLGQHKTGSTHIQHHLLGHRRALLSRGVLVPNTGVHEATDPVRPGALPGHQGLAAALRREDDDAIWHDLADEIRWNRCKTVVISCENLGFPTDPDRAVLIQRLAGRLGGFDKVDLIALQRQPDKQIEAFYREWVALGLPSGRQDLNEFLVNHRDALLDLPAFCAPFEEAFNTRLNILSFETMRETGLWKAFCQHAGLPIDLPDLPAPQYPTPDRQSTEILRLLNSFAADPKRRADLTRAWFRLHPTPDHQLSAMPPEDRLSLLDQWEALSAPFAAERGYRPDLQAMRDQITGEAWHAPNALSLDRLGELITLLDASASTGAKARAPHTSAPQSTTNKGAPVLTIRLRPWASNLLRRAGLLKT